MPKEWWVVGLSFISGILVTLIAGWFTLHAKRSEYLNEYFKVVLARRLDAYEEVERLITMIKVAVLDTDQRPYHLLFTKNYDYESAYKLLFSILSKALWLSDEIYYKTRELNLLIYSHGNDNNGLIEFGKKHYTKIAELRTILERLHARDMLVLYNIPRFLRSKKPSDGYASLEAPLLQWGKGSEAKGNDD